MHDVYSKRTLLGRRVASLKLYVKFVSLSVCLFILFYILQLFSKLTQTSEVKGSNAGDIHFWRTNLRRVERYLKSFKYQVMSCHAKSNVMLFDSNYLGN